MASLVANQAQQSNMQSMADMLGNNVHSSIDDTPRVAAFGALSISQIDSKVNTLQGPTQSEMPTVKRVQEQPLIKYSKHEQTAVERILQQDATPCKRDFLVLNNLNHSNRNSSLKAGMYADEDEDRSLKYYKLGKSAQNIFKDSQMHLQRELSPIKFRESSFDKKVLN